MTERDPVYITITFHCTPPWVVKIYHDNVVVNSGNRKQRPTSYGFALDLSDFSLTTLFSLYDHSTLDEVYHVIRHSMDRFIKKLIIDLEPGV